MIYVVVHNRDCLLCFCQNPNRKLTLESFPNKKGNLIEVNLGRRVNMKSKGTNKHIEIYCLFLLLIYYFPQLEKNLLLIKTT